MRLLISTISLPILLVAASAEAGQIVWRSPVAGILQVAASAPVTPSNPGGEGPSTTFGVSYKGATVAAGSNVSISPEGRSAQHTFAMAPGSDMPIGLILNPSTGTITGRAIQAGVYTIMIRVSDGDFSEAVPVTLTIA